MSIDIDFIVNNQSDEKIFELLDFPRYQTFLYTNIRVLGLSVRSYNALLREGIKTIGEIYDRTVKDLISFRNFGKFSLVEILSRLASFQKEEVHKFKNDELFHLLDELLADYKNDCLQIKETSKLKNALLAILDLMPDSYPKANQILEAINKDDDSFTGSIKLGTIPESIREKELKAFADAYAACYDSKLNVNSFSKDDKVKDIINYLSFDNSIGHNKSTLDFYHWLSQDIDLSSSFIFSDLNERSIKVLQARSNGTTFEKISKELELTSERVRQIDIMAWRAILRNPSTKDLIIKLFAMKNNRGILCKNDFLPVCQGEQLSILWYLIESGRLNNNYYYYAPRYQCIILDSMLEKGSTKLIDSIHSFPPKLSNKELDERILSLNQAWGWCFDLILLEIHIQFKQINDKYIKEKITFGDMCEIVLKDHFPNGVRLANENDFRSFLHYLDSDFSWKGEITPILLQRRIHNCSYLVGKGTYRHISSLNVSDDGQKAVKQIMENALSDRNRTAWTFNELFEKNKTVLLEHGIENQYVLHTLVLLLGGKATKDYYVRSDQDYSYDGDFTRYVQHSYPIGINELCKEFCVSETQCDQIINRCYHLYTKGPMVFYKD